MNLNYPFLECLTFFIYSIPLPSPPSISSLFFFLLFLLVHYTLSSLVLSSKAMITRSFLFLVVRYCCFKNFLYLLFPSASLHQNFFYRAIFVFLDFSLFPRPSKHNYCARSILSSSSKFFVVVLLFLLHLFLEYRILRLSFPLLFTMFLFCLFPHYIPRCFSIKT